MVGTGLQYAGQAQSAKDAAKFQNEQYKSVSTAALDSYKRGITSLQTRGDQQFAAASADATANSRDAEAARSAYTAHAGASGVSGNTVDLLLNDFSSIEGVNEEAIRTNYRWQTKQIQEEMLGLRANAQSRISSAAPQTIRGPSPLALGVGLAGQGLQAGANIYSLEMQSKYGSWFDAPRGRP